MILEEEKNKMMQEGPSTKKKATWSPKYEKLPKTKRMMKRPRMVLELSKGTISPLKNSTNLEIWLFSKLFPKVEIKSSRGR